MGAKSASFRYALQGTAVFCAALVGGGVAYAQQSTPAPSSSGTSDEAIVVHGYRASVQTSIDTKRRANNMVDVIHADDMASFPDANLSEAIQRIPGVSINRDGGEGREISVRGLPEDFIQTTMDGVEAYSSTTGSTLGSLLVNRNRGFDYSTFAADLFNQVTVYKTQSAELDEGSIGASVDLQTARPFDFDGLHFNFTAEGAHYDIGGPSVSPRISALLTDTWHNQFGALFSVAYNTRTAIEDGYSDTSQSGYSDVNGGFCTPAGSSITTKVNALSPAPSATPICWSHLGSDPTAFAAVMAPNVFMPKNPGLGRFQNEQTRLGMTTAFQYRPTDQIQMTLDLVYSQYNEDQTDYALSQASNNRAVNGGSATFPQTTGVPDTQIEQVGIDPNGQVNYMLINNADIKHIQELHNSKTESWVVAYHLDLDFTDRLRSQTILSESRTFFNLPFDYFVSFDHFGNEQAYNPTTNAGNIYSWDARGPYSQQRPFINYGYDVTNPANVTFVPSNSLGNPGQSPDIRIFRNEVTNSLLNAQETLSYELNDAVTFRLGGQHKTYHFHSDSWQRTQANNSAIASLPPSAFNFTNFAAAFPSLAPLTQRLSGFGDELGLPSGSVSGWVVPNVSAFIKGLGLDCNCVNSFGDWTISDISTGARSNTRRVNENDDSIFLQADYNFPIFGSMMLRGNGGVRFVRTEEEAFGLANTAPFAQIKATNSYNDVLPSFNAALEVTSDVVVRFGMAKVMSRPVLANLTPGLAAINTAGAPPSVTVGNINLEPYRATNTDLSLEWYPTRGSLFSIAWFNKDISNYAQQLTALEPFGQTGLPLSLLAAGQTASTIYNVTTFRNTQGGYIRGFEANVQVPFTFLPGLLGNTGVLFNYTHISSRLGYFLSAAATTPFYADFVGVSPNSYNATAFYDDGRLQGRVSVAYRSEYIQQAGFIANLPDVRGGAAATNVDASASYKLTDHLQIKFDAINLTNQGTDDWSGQTRKAQRVYSVTGRQFFLGAQYQF